MIERKPFYTNGMEDMDMLDEMLTMQKEVDDFILSSHGLTEDSVRDRVKYALLDEVGEFNHATKDLWCWWKKRHAVDWTKALEEYVDIVHFVLMLALITTNGAESLKAGFQSSVCVTDMDGRLSWTVFDLIPSDTSSASMSNLGKALALVGRNHGFSWATVYEAYKAKNQINRQRVQEGY